MGSQRLIDTSEAAARQRRLRRRRAWRIAVPVGFVVVLLAAQISIALYSYRANRAAAARLSDDVIVTLSSRISSEVEAYLRPAAELVQLTARLAEIETVKPEAGGEVERFAIELLRGYDQLAMVNLGNPEGDFIMPKQMPDGSVHTKLIDREGDDARVRWVRRSVDGAQTGVEFVPYDGYDPRVRPWYLGAVEADGLYWTDVYIFFTDRSPGVTASYPIHGPGGSLRGVLGIDIELDRLSDFLSGLEIGEAGRAVIIDGAGNLVAHPDPDAVMAEVDGKLVTRNVTDGDDEALERAYNRFRVEGHGQRVVNIDGEAYRTSAMPLSGTVGRDWTVLIVVPEEDFIGFVGRNNRRTLLMSTAVLALAVILATLLVVQGLRSDRQAQGLLDYQRRLKAMGDAFADLSADPAVLDPGDPAGVDRLTRRAATAAESRRVSVWRMADDHRLHCDSVFDAQTDGHTRGLELDVRAMRGFAQAIAAGEAFETDDAAADERTRGFYDRYLRPLNISAVQVAPIAMKDGCAGAVVVERDSTAAARTDETRTFAQTLATLMVARLRTCRSTGRLAAEPGPPSTDAEPARPGEPRAESAAADADRGPPRLAHGRDAAPAGAPPRLVEDAVVMVVQSQAVNGDEAGVAAELHRIAAALVHDADRLGIEHVTVRGDTIVAAAGLADGVEAETVATRVAEAALALRDTLDRAGDAGPGAWSIGIHGGRALVTTGADGSVDLAGPAIRVAARLAASAPGRSIQVSGAVYDHVRRGFVLQERGRFFVSGVGATPAFLLVEST